MRGPHSRHSKRGILAYGRNSVNGVATAAVNLCNHSLLMFPVTVLEPNDSTFCGRSSRRPPAARIGSE